MPLDGQENILWLQISVDYSFLMKVPQTQQNFSCVELSFVLSEHLLSIQVVEQLTSV